MLIFVLLPLYAWCATPTVAANLLPANVDGLKSQFQTALKSISDIASLHYSIAGSKELGVQTPDSLCNDIKRLVDKSNVESIYHGTEAAKALANCKVIRSAEARSLHGVSSSSSHFSYLLKTFGPQSPPHFNPIRAAQQKSTMPFDPVSILV